MSQVKVGPLPNGGVCVSTQDVGDFNVRLIKEPDNAYTVIYSFDRTRLETFEYDCDEQVQASSDYRLIVSTLKNAQACLKP